MKIPRRLLAFAVPAVVVLLAGAGVFLRIRGAAENAESAAPTGDAVAPGPAATAAFATDVAIPVAGAPVVRDTLVVSVNAAGQAAAWRRVTFLAQVAGPVARIAVRESDVASAGALLLELDPAEHQLTLREAEAGLARAQATYRELTLFDDRIGDDAVRAERERAARAKSGLDAAEVALERARRDLERTRVAAPFAGRVADLRVVPGQWIQAGQELLTLVQLDPIAVEAQVLEGDLTHLAPRRRARVTFAALPDEVFTGRIETINPLVDEATRTARVIVAVPNPHSRILPGMYARVSLEARRYPDRILVPRAAILERDRRTMLFVLQGDAQGGLAKWRYVTTGLENEEWVEIVAHPETEMVRPGEVVLTDGHYTLVHDARVRLVENVKAAGGRPQ